MLFRLTKYLVAPLMAAMAAGCSDSLDAPETPGAGMVVLTFRNAEGTRSAASDASEAKIDNLVVALYPDAPGEDAPAVAFQTFTGLNASVSAKVTMNLTDEMKAALFGGISGTSCKLFAVANVDDPTAVPANASIAQLKGITATSQFDTKKVQPSFVMAGSGTVTYTVTGDIETAAGSATLNRAAAKISLNIKLPEFVEDEAKNRWYPVTGAGSIRVLLKNGVKNGVACPADGWAPADESEYFDITVASTETVRTFSNNGGSYPWQTDVPFYTYPNVWEETPSEKHKTSMTLLVPWQKAGEATYQTFYYQVPVTDMSKLLANYSYTVNLNVGMLGSLSPETPEEVDGLSYRIVNWGETDINADFKDNRYLVVSPTTYEADNEETITIPFYTSHPAEISDITMEYKRYNFYSDGKGDVVSFTISKAQIDRSVKETDTLCSYNTITQALTGEHLIIIRHPLKVWKPLDSRGNEVSLTGRNVKPETVQKDIYRYSPTEDFAYSPYTIKFTIRHIDNPDYSENVTINQYPGIYIEAAKNEGGHYRTWYGEDDYGYVYVNPTWNSRYSYWTNDSDLGGVHGLTGGGNTNPNMYIIRVTTLQGLDSRYTIGDPRSLYINNSLTGSGNLIPTEDETTAAGGWNNEAAALYNESGATNKRKLRYYYPTIEADPDNTQLSYMIAPKIRIASSYGVTNDVSRQNARRRAATYQEQGCPAGRWRLPTLGEFTFIIQLSATGKIPHLFSVGYGYHTAQGVYKVESNGTVTKSSSGNAYIRAVYDEWYWDNETDYVMQKNADGGYDYTLGDIPRNMTRSTARIEKYKRMMKKQQ